MSYHWTEAFVIGGIQTAPATCCYLSKCWIKCHCWTDTKLRDYIGWLACGHVLQTAGTSCPATYFSRRWKSPDQVGFRRIRSTCNQVAALTTHATNGFQQQLKTRAVFLDFTAAYDMVLHTGLLCKLSRSMPCWFARLVKLVLRNRRFRVHMEDDTSSWRTNPTVSHKGLSYLQLSSIPTLTTCRPQCHTCRWHLLCEARTYFCRTEMQPHNRHGTNSSILSPPTKPV